MSKKPVRWRPGGGEGGNGEWEGDEESSSLGTGHNQENILVA